MINFNISSLLRILLVAMACSTPVIFYELDRVHSYLDLWGLCLIEFIYISLFFALGSFSKKYPPAIIAAVILFAFVGLRLFFITIFPDSLLGDIDKITPAFFNGVLSYLLLGTWACFLGIAIGYSRRKAVPLPQTREAQGIAAAPGPRFFFYLHVLFCLCQALIYFRSGYAGSTGSGEQLDFTSRYLSRFMDTTVSLTLFLTAYAMAGKKSIRDEFYFYTACAIFVTQAFLAGSRGGLYECAMLLISYKIFFDGHLTLKASPWLLILGSALIPASMLAYFAATELRELQWMGGGVSLGSAVDLLRNLDLGQIDFEKLLGTISYRLSLVEPVFYSMLAGFGGRDVSDLVNVKTSLISSLNRLIPGKPFGDVLFTEYAYGFLLSNEGIFFLDNYSGYEWGMHAISYQLFGFAGGLIFIFLMTALLAHLIRRAMPVTSFMRGALGVFALYTMQNWVKNFGIDNLVDRTVHRLVILVFYVMALQIVRTAASKNDASQYQRLPGR